MASDDLVQTEADEIFGRISTLFYWWKLPLRWMFNKKVMSTKGGLKQKNGNTSEHLGDRLERKWSKALNLSRKTRRRPSLFSVLWKAFGRRFMGLGCLLCASETLVCLGRAYMITGLISYLEKSPSVKHTHFGAYSYAAGIVLSSLAYVALQHSCLTGFYRIGMKVRIACFSLVYRKVVYLHNESNRDLSVRDFQLLFGEESSFHLSFVCVHYIWIMIVQTPIVAYLLWLLMGRLCVVAVCFVFLCLPLTIIWDHRKDVLAGTVTLTSEGRYSTMGEVLHGMRTIKIRAMEPTFTQFLTKFRRREMSTIWRYFVNEALSYVCRLVYGRLYICLVVTLFFLLRYELSAKNVTCIIIYLNILQRTVVTNGSTGILQAYRLRHAFKLMQMFLCQDDFESESAVVLGGPTLKGKEFAVKMTDCWAKWDAGTDEKTLKNLNLTLKPGTLVVISGPKFAGKSSLLRVMLKQLPISKGSLEVKGSLSYTSQTPWVFPGSVQDNVTFGLPMNRRRFYQTLRMCSLQKESEELTEDQLTNAPAISLADDVRSKINLARAIYRDVDIYLLDECFSKINVADAKEIFGKCIKSYLKSKICVLVTNDLHYMKHADHIVVMANGKITAQGSYKELRKQKVNFAAILPTSLRTQATSQCDSSISKRGGQLDLNFLQSTVCRDVRDSAGYVKVPEEVHIESLGSCCSHEASAYTKSFGAGACSFILCVLAVEFVLAQALASGADYFVMYWVDDTLSSKEEKLSKNLELLMFYRSNTNASVYVILVLGAAVVSFLASFAYFYIAKRASVSLHGIMLKNVMGATLDFFKSNSADVLARHFSEDLYKVDFEIPKNLLAAVQTYLSIVGILVVISILSYFFLLPSLLFFLALQFFQRFYDAATRMYKKANGKYNVPEIFHLTTTMQGLATIRALRGQRIVLRSFDDLQDMNATRWYRYMFSCRARELWMEVVWFLYLVLVVYLFAFVLHCTPAQVGLAMIEACSLYGAWHSGLCSKEETEEHSAAIDRILHYIYVPQEKAVSDREPPKLEETDIVIKDIYVELPEGAKLISGLNVHATQGELVGFATEVDAAKTFFLEMLLGFVNFMGEVTINGVEVRQLNTHKLRSAVSLVPEDPVLFSGTLRRNLDPDFDYEDEEIWAALEKVKLKAAIGELSGGLNSAITPEQEMFGLGDRRLLSLARALLRAKLVLLVEEAADQGDLLAEELIQDTVRNQFKNLIVFLLVKSGLHTVMDANQLIVVGANGQTECDHPYLLLQDSGSILFDMVESRGTSTVQRFSEVARKAYVLGGQISGGQIKK